VSNYKEYSNRLPWRQFSRDFQAYIEENKIVVMRKIEDHEVDVFVVTPNQLYSTETLLLNELVFKTLKN
jgi:hypothetical protein